MVSVTVPVPENRVPILVVIGNKQINEGELLNFTVTAVDDDGDNLTYTASNLPSGSSFDGLSRVFSWNPGFDQGGTYSNVDFHVSDGKDTTSESISIQVLNVNRGPVLATIASITVNEGEVVSINPTGTDPDGDVLSFSYSGWMTSASYTTVSGDVGIHTVTVTASDGTLSASQDVSVTVVQSTAAVTLSWTANTESDLGGYKIYYGLSSRVYPNVVDATNVTSYTLPIEAGVDVYLALTAYDTSGNESGFSSELIHNSSITANQAPVLGLIPDLNVNEGDIVSIPKTGTDPDGDLLTYSYSGWMTSPSYTTVVGDAGIHDVTVTVTDGIASASQDVAITVNGTLNVTLSWLANTESDLAGYKLYYGRSTGIYDNIVDVKNVISYSMSVSVGVDIFFALTAYDTSGNESGFSSELLFNSSIPSLPAGRVLVGAKDGTREVSEKDKVDKGKIEEYKEKDDNKKIDAEHTQSKQSDDEESEEIGINRWKPLPLRTGNQYDFGLAGGEGMQQIGGISYAPSNPNTIYLVTKESQVWKSRDGGISWEMKNHGFIANGGISISVDPNNEDLVLVAGLSRPGSISNNIADGIYRTKNGGKTWEMVKQTSFQRVGVPDFKNGVNNMGGVNFDFSKLGVIYTGTHEDGLLRSLDGGDTWKTVLPNSKTGKILDVKGHPNDYYSLFLAAENGVYSIKDDDVVKMVEEDSHFFMNNSSFCTKCHERSSFDQGELPLYDNVFKPIPSGINKTATCLGCHKVEDESHPVNIKPKRATPADLPLGTNGEITCLTCHYAHGPTRVKQTVPK